MGILKYIFINNLWIKEEFIMKIIEYLKLNGMKILYILKFEGYN